MSVSIPTMTTIRKPQRPHVTPTDGVREIVDFVLVVLTLLFVFRTFVAEAFVIPTGSMAPTLMGLHKDLRCSNCGCPYQVNASSEDLPPGQPAEAQSSPPYSAVAACTCPVCRFTMQLDEEPSGPFDSYSGDRIMVSKAAYLLGEPQRFDVVVFKYPAQAATNFIKRLVGLPEESVKISHGNIYIRPYNGQQYTIARKSPDKVRALLQLVHDQDAAVASAQQGDDGSIGWLPESPPQGETAAWQTVVQGRAFECRGTGRNWLRYHHTPPSYNDRLAASLALQGSLPRRQAQLVTDFTAYNTNRPSQASYFPQAEDVAEPDIEAVGMHWVGDLAVELELTVLAPAGEFLLELVEGGRRFGCALDLATGLAKLSIAGLESFQPAGQTMVRGTGTHRLRFANVDDQLLLWVDETLVEFRGSTTYDDLDNDLPALADLAPVGVASPQAAVRIAHLRVFRDGYYIAARGSEKINDYTQDPLSLAPAVDVHRHSDGDRLARLMSEPGLWPQLFALRRAVEFRLGADQYLVLGDNSARSKDSRFWTTDAGGGGDATAHTVPRHLLIGKAVLIYWPHSWNRTSRDGAWFPYFPNLDRMGVVR